MVVRWAVLSSTVTRSFCVVCDAEPGGCTHQAARYLEDITYQPGPSGGWIVPDHEKERWHAPSLRPEPRTPADEPRPIGDLLADVDGLVYMDDRLEQRLRDLHQLEPLKVTRLVAALLDGVARGSLVNPGGFLTQRAQELERKTNTQ